ncbi:TPA: isoprenyl transferase [Candidatus Galligastranaerophilus intestinavium]|uniref:Isoprenyl transferase n=1 Tax=Candidatus Galligastranaerophilus intestinavium TaxID=2840836 RepID=A0A9D1FIS5_9BACT|nr:isoprenyl transferase [Candidatus Galligastranaerophilus intestinavium]
MLQTLEKNEIKDIVEQTKLKHIAIIMDGNRRWAKKNMLPSAMGHKKGVEALKKTLKAAHKFGVKYLTLYAFSTENWNRKQEEVDFLMNLLANTMKSQLEELNQNNVKLRFIGYLKALNPTLQEILAQAVETTKNNTGVNLQIAINYGARNEIVNAIKDMMYQGVKPEDVNEELVSKFLYTSSVPDPDLLIRTGGEMRISNYLLWQIAYCELYITKTFWPEFDEEALKNSILEFAKRQRRWGG